MPSQSMAHLLPPAGITYPASETFRNYLVRPPAKKQQDKEVIVCCERMPPSGPCCRSDVRCKVIDGDQVFTAKLCPDSSDIVTNFCVENDCRPRPPLTQPGLLCCTSCEDKCPPPCPKVCPTPGLRTCKTFTFRQPCPPCPNPCSKPRPFSRPCRPPRASSASCGNRPRLVKESITSHCYTYQY
ncbi:hypothetical protein EGW08_001222 [Elysia chlorotica]|uniref:Uncharacterized protein n=1 Tax=Elysia chlorotica TaxID=188477 RepID=A0A433UAZ7_ELYCH|nr:hypothetical protein EGW08_001222 [Elysia chlorotica]